MDFHPAFRVVQWGWCPWFYPSQASKAAGGNPTVRQVKARARQTLKALLGAMIGGGCQILCTDPDQGLVTFRSDRRTFKWPLGGRGSEVPGTLQVVPVSDGREVWLGLSGHIDWHVPDGPRSEGIDRRRQALHQEFLDVAQRGVQK